MDNEFNSELFSTVLIGSNGSGKSYLMTMIVEIFRFIENELFEINSTNESKNKKDNLLKYDYYNLIYALNNKVFDVTIRNSKEITLKIDDHKTNIKKIKLPKKVLAVSFMVNDKFIFRSERSMKSIYSYLGVRESSNLTFTSSIQKNICYSIIENLENIDVSNSINQVLEFLNYESTLHIKFNSNNKEFFKEFGQEIPSLFIYTDLKDYLKNRIEIMKEHE